jgi:hypothetical protein
MTSTRASASAARLCSRASHLANLAYAIAGAPLLAIFTLALAVRLLATMLFTGLIDPEGAEYARIAQNLLQGNGYSGIAEPGTQLFFPPLFPFAIAAVTLVTGNAELAGRLISLIMGALIVVPVFWIAMRMYGRRTALLAAGIAACHPYLVYMSTTVYSEMTYLTLLLSAIAFVFSAMADPGIRNLVAAGGAYGLAALIRAEVLLCMLVSTALILVGLHQTRKKAAPAGYKRVGLLVATFVLVTAPYAAWLSLQVGQLRWEGKSPLNLSTDLRILQGENPIEAQFGVNASGAETGVWNQPNLVTIKSFSMTAGQFLDLVEEKTMHVLRNSSEAIGSHLLFGGPIMLILVAFGLFSRPWSTTLTLCQLQLFAVVGLACISTYFIYYNAPRFYIVLGPIYAIWAAAGLRSAVTWAAGTARAYSWNGRAVRGMAATLWLAVPFLLTAASAGVLAMEARATRPIKSLAEQQQRSAPRPLHVLDSHTVVSFHAAATHFWLPYADSATAAKYIDKNAIDLVVLRTAEADTRPYARAWIEKGLPIGNARLLQTFDLRGGERVIVYKIDRNVRR